MADYDLTQTGQEVQDILDGAAMQTDLTAETERAELAEQTLQGGIDAEETRAKAAEKQNADDIDVIESKIPAGASDQNQLADKEFVNNSIATATATYRGAYNLVNDLSLTVGATHEQIATALAGAIDTADNNDYCFVQIPTSDAAPTQIASIERYKFNGTAWAYEYTLNNSGFTAAQWAALNSGITSGLVAKLLALPTNDALTLALAGKQDVLTFDNVPVDGSNNPVKSGGVYSAIGDEETRAKAAEKANADDIDDIEALIPATASDENQLADKEYVNSSISTATATYRGSFNEVNDLSLTTDATHEQIATALAGAISTADNNDYCFVQIPTSDAAPTQIASIERYKFNGTAWAYEYTLNNSGFTAAQWAALNSGITSGLVAKLSALPTNDALTLALAGKQDVLTFDNEPTSGSNNPVKSGGVYDAIDAEATTRAAAIAAIVALIPEAASALNQLADKAFVNSSISTATAVFKGTYNVVVDLELSYNATQEQIATMLASKIISADNNDYCFVQIPTSDAAPLQIARTDRYKFNGTVWAYEYTLNNSGFTTAQWAAINSGITSLLKDKLIDLPTATELTALLAAKQNQLTFDTTPTTGSTNPVTSGGIKSAIDAEKTRAEAAEGALDSEKADKATTLAGYGITDAYTKSETYTKTEVNGLVSTPHQNYVTVPTYASLPSSGQSTDTIYRVSSYDGANNQVDDTVYSEYAWDGTQYVFLCVKSQIEEVFDITVYNNNTKYADLSAALGVDGANIPATLRRGGMSVKFVQSSDNKYVQYRLRSDSFNTIVSNWYKDVVSVSQNISSGHSDININNQNYPVPSLGDLFAKGILSFEFDIVGGINGSDGTDSNNTDYRRTQYAKVTQGMMLSYNVWAGSTGWATVACYDSNGDYLSAVTIKGESSGTFIIPSGVSFVRLSSSASYANTFARFPHNADNVIDKAITDKQLSDKLFATINRGVVKFNIDGGVGYSDGTIALDVLTERKTTYFIAVYEGEKIEYDCLAGSTGWAAVAAYDSQFQYLQNKSVQGIAGGTIPNKGTYEVGSGVAYIVLCGKSSYTNKASFIVETPNLVNVVPYLKYGNILKSRGCIAIQMDLGSLDNSYSGHKSMLDTLRSYGLMSMDYAINITALDDPDIDWLLEKQQEGCEVIYHNRINSPSDFSANSQLTVEEAKEGVCDERLAMTQKGFTTFGVVANNGSIGSQFKPMIDDLFFWNEYGSAQILTSGAENTKSQYLLDQRIIRTGFEIRHSEYTQALEQEMITKGKVWIDSLCTNKTFGVMYCHFYNTTVDDYHLYENVLREMAEYIVEKINDGDLFYGSTTECLNYLCK